MSNIKRVSLTTIESNHEKIKTKRKGSFRISIPLVEEPASREYSHFNYETLYKSALDKKRQKKDTNGALQNGGGLTNGGGLEFDEDGLGGDEDELVKMAKKFEQKYGGTVKKDKYSELGAGYDDEDSFIDNTDAYNDELSEDLLPKHGGYYLNRGSLVLERIPEEVIENEEELCARKIKRTIRVIQSSDEEEGGEEEESSEAEESGRDEDDEDDSEEDEDEEETDNEEEKNEDVNSRIKEKKSTPSEAKLNVHSEENGVHVDNKKSCTDKKTIPNSTQQGTGTPTPGVVPNNTHPTTGTSIMSTIESVVGNVKSHEHGNEVGVIKKKKKRKREREEEEEEEGEEERNGGSKQRKRDEMSNVKHHKHGKKHHKDKNRKSVYEDNPNNDRKQQDPVNKMKKAATVKELLNEKKSGDGVSVSNSVASTLPPTATPTQQTTIASGSLPSSEDVDMGGTDDVIPLPSPSPLLNGHSDPSSSFPNLPPTDLKIPETLPDDVRDLITTLKRVANQVPNLSSRKTFPSDVNDLLIDLEAKCRTIPSANKNAVYAHLGTFIPLSKDTLIKRARKMSVDKEEERLEATLAKLKMKIDAVMPGVLLQYSKDCEMAAKKAASENQLMFWNFKAIWAMESTTGEGVGSQQVQQRSQMPRRVFPWDEELRCHVRELVNIKANCYRIMNCRMDKDKEVDYIKEYLETKVKILWPDGWMKSLTLLREGKSNPSVRSKKYIPKPASRKQPTPPQTASLPGASLPSSNKPGDPTPHHKPSHKVSETTAILVSPKAQALLSSLESVNQPHSYHKDAAVTAVTHCVTAMTHSVAPMTHSVTAATHSAPHGVTAASLFSPQIPNSLSTPSSSTSSITSLSTKVSPTLTPKSCSSISTSVKVPSSVQSICSGTNTDLVITASPHLSSTAPTTVSSSLSGKSGCNSSVSKPTPNNPSVTKPVICTKSSSVSISSVSKPSPVISSVSKPSPLNPSVSKSSQNTPNVPKSSPSPTPHSISSLINTTKAHVSSSKFHQYPPENVITSGGPLGGAPASSLSVKSAVTGTADLLPPSTSLSSLLVQNYLPTSLAYGISSVYAAAAAASNAGKLPTPLTQPSISLAKSCSTSTSPPVFMPPYSTSSSMFSPSQFPTSSPSSHPHTQLPKSSPQSTSVSPPKKRTSTPSLSSAGEPSSILDLSPKGSNASVGQSASAGLKQQDRSASDLSSRASPSSTPQGASTPIGSNTPLQREQATSPVSSKTGSMLSLKQRILQDNASKGNSISHHKDEPVSKPYPTVSISTSSSSLASHREAPKHPESLSTTPTLPVSAASMLSAMISQSLRSVPVSQQQSSVGVGLPKGTNLFQYTTGATSFTSSCSSGGFSGNASIVTTAASAVKPPQPSPPNVIDSRADVTRGSSGSVLGSQPRERKSSRSSSKDSDGKEQELVADVLKSLMSLNQMSSEHSGGSPDKSRGFHNDSGSSQGGRSFTSSPSSVGSALPKMQLGFEDEYKKHLKQSTPPTGSASATDFVKKTFQSDQAMLSMNLNREKSGNRSMMNSSSATEFSMKMSPVVTSTPTPPHLTQDS